jgi:predicted secreted protein
MTIGTGIAIYFLIWWLTLFITLPFKMTSQIEDGVVVEGSDPAAPTNPMMGKRMLWNTVFAAFVFFIFWFVVYYLGIGLDSIPEIIPIRRIDS